jgi:hypothetical protein
LENIKTLSKFLATLLAGSLLFTACSKNEFYPLPEPDSTESCVPATENPNGRSYSAEWVATFNCTDNICGLMPMNRSNFWVYEDSIFNLGVFSHVKYDTLRFTQQMKTLQDGLVWWKPNTQVGLPDAMYVSDSSFYNLSERLFAPGYWDAKKDFGLFSGDSIRFQASFHDYAATGRGIRLSSPIDTEMGRLTDCYYFEKLARNFRRDQVWIKPGIGVIRYTYEQANNGFPRVVTLRKISTLVDYYIVD